MKQMITARRQKSWDLRAAANFIGGGTGTGLIVMSVAAGFFGADTAVSLAVGAGFVMAGLSMVWLEIGKPWRALNVFFHPQTSWMTREGIVAGPLVAAVAGCVLVPLPGLPLAAAILAAGFLFCQARILKASRGIPAWKQPALLPFILVTGWAEGAAMLVLLGEASPLAFGVGLAAGLARAVVWRAV
ncbi:Phenylacetyl-CoA:acceptor oxidoreductase (fragment) [Candidatus Terasakiella magnetica]